MCPSVVCEKVVGLLHLYHRYTSVKHRVISDERTNVKSLNVCRGTFGFYYERVCVCVLVVLEFWRVHSSAAQWNK